jgi:hypothetical protein
VIVAYGYCWELLGRMDFSSVLRMGVATKAQYIFGNRYKYITKEIIANFKESLLLAEIRDFKIYKNEGGKQKCEFEYKGIRYVDMSMTDPDYYHYLKCKIDKAYIVVSLPHVDFPQGKYYKFIAKVFPLTPVINLNHEVIF